LVLTKDIVKRKKFILIHYYKNNLTYGSGQKERKIIKPFLKKNVKTGIKTIAGTVVSAGCGKIQGIVRILSTARHVDKMKEGEVLVASMTSPEFIVAMRKAAAIINDEGGITSHAAIVSRELNIPCIVGAKIATKVLKDGQLVGVNANHGIISILEK
jgi:pyruvate,water dikinase